MQISRTSVYGTAYLGRNLLSETPLLVLIHICLALYIFYLTNVHVYFSPLFDIFHLSKWQVLVEIMVVLMHITITFKDIGVLHIRTPFVTPLSVISKSEFA